MQYKNIEQYKYDDEGTNKPTLNHAIYIYIYVFAFACWSKFF